MTVNAFRSIDDTDIASTSVVSVMQANGLRLVVILSSDQDAVLPSAVRLGISTKALRHASPKDMAISLDAYLGDVRNGCPQKLAKIMASSAEAYLHDVESGMSASGCARLSVREREISMMAAQGLTNPEIAEKLGTSKYTVRNQLGKAMAKLNTPNRGALASVLLGLRRPPARHTNLSDVAE